MSLDKALKNLLYLAAILTLAAMSTFFLVAAQVAVETQKTMASTRSLVEDTHVQIKGTVQNTNAVLIQWGLASDEIRRASMEQRQLLRQTSQQTVILLKHANQTLETANFAISHTDQNATELTAATIASLRPLPDLLNQGTNTLAAANQTLISANQVISDPAIPSTLKHIDGTMTSVDDSTKLIDQKIQDLTKPARLLKRIFFGAAEWARAARSFLP